MAVANRDGIVEDFEEVLLNDCLWTNARLS